MSESMQERILRMKKEKEAASAKKPSMVSQLAHEEESVADFDKIAQTFENIKVEKTPGANDGYIKDTLYIREDIYRSFNALCSERGLKKQYANEALADFVLKKYKEIKAQDKELQ